MVFLAIPGLMASPLYFLSRFVAERKAREAVAASSVRLPLPSLFKTPPCESAVPAVWREVCR